MTSTELLAFLQDFYKELLELTMARQANARLVGAYDANNAFQQILGRQDVHLRWVSDAVEALGGSIGEAPREEPRPAGDRRQQTHTIEADANAQRAFIDRWRDRIRTVTNARHQKMLNLILGEMSEHLRALEQALDGRTDVLGRHADGKELKGEVLPVRPGN